MGNPTLLVDVNGLPLHTNGHAKPREELIDSFNATHPKRARRASLSYDNARGGNEYDNIWIHTDSFDADSANSRGVRLKLIRNSRYEAGSNGFYAGILQTHVNMMMGVGPTLRMLTANKNFNQFVERRFYEWSLLVGLAQKLWSMAHARIQDGESFGILQNNPALGSDVQLDVKLIEAEQCHTPFMPFDEPGYIDGIRFDPKTGEKLWYDILPAHPGSTNQSSMTQKPIRVPPRFVLHWFKAVRPGAHRGIPALTSTLNTGAASRRWREATLAAAETAADFTMFIKTQAAPNEIDPVASLSTLDIQKRMMTALPMGYDPMQMKAEQPTSSYAEFMRAQLMEEARPIGMPYLVAAADSSNSNFSSAKLDTLCYRAALDVERQDFDAQVLDPLFALWFEEWSILNNSEDTPAHQWDWPGHPVIDAVAEATARDTRLKNGTLSMRDDATEHGEDYEDQLRVQAEDAFGQADDSAIEKMRKINVLRNTPQHALPFVAQILGVEIPVPTQEAP